MKSTPAKQKHTISQSAEKSLYFGKNRVVRKTRREWLEGNVLLTGEVADLETE